jgi:hypothetical protein
MNGEYNDANALERMNLDRGDHGMGLDSYDPFF